MYKKYAIITANKKHLKAIKKVKEKTKIKVVFFVMHASVWKYDGLYKIFEAEERFTPLVVIFPYMGSEKTIVRNQIDDAYNFFLKKKYNVLKTYNEKNDKWLDIKKEVNPDIIFFSMPYRTKIEYDIINYLNCLTCYVPYGYMITHRPYLLYQQLLHNLVFRFYVESEFHLEQVKKYTKTKGSNAVVVGYPGIDDLLFPKEIENKTALWKKKDMKLKRIIWAPHYTIFDNGTNFCYSNFLEYYQIMFEIAKKYEDSIQIAFKPHPVLKSELYKNPDWGKKRTDKYCKQWAELENGQLNESDYIELFLSSDAMIFDSGSFIAEYLCVNKPSLYQVRNKNIPEGFGELGKKAIACHYQAFAKEDLFNFIEDVVLGGNDSLRQKRENFVQNYLMPPNNKKACENIYSDICKTIGI
ncbi:MAG: CDP-glycerol glycerophosphotransferase family protein [Candidatus Omnitrophota bacterium]|jgi:CDP-glycerol glycerophosphotransferase (TagB/SpsB family)